MRKELAEENGWRTTAVVDTCAQGHWVEVLEHPEIKGVLLVGDCCDHKRVVARVGEKPDDFHFPEPGSEIGMWSFI